MKYILFSIIIFLVSSNSIASVDMIREFKFGILDHDISYLFTKNGRERSIDLNIEVIFTPSLNVFSGTLYPALGASINTHSDTSKVYFDARLEYSYEHRLFFVIGLGGAVHNGHSENCERIEEGNDGNQICFFNFSFDNIDDALHTKFLGSRFLFHIPLEFGYRINEKYNVSLYLDHISNYDTQDFNEGLDAIGIRFGFLY